MATFSQGFLSSLGRPAMTQSLFDLGAAIGGVPGQLQQRKQRREEAGMLAGLTPGSVEYNQAMAKIAQQRGELEKAAQFGTAARQQLQTAGQQEMASQQERGKQALSKFASARGMTLSNPRTRETFFRLASTYQVPVEEAASIYSSFEDLSGQDEQTRVNNDLAAGIEKQYPKVARALRLGDPEAKKFAYKFLTNSLEEDDEKDIEYKFGQSTDRARDSKGNQYLISTRKNPNTGEVVVVHSPIGNAPEYDAKKQGGLTFISRQGETASETRAAEIDQEDTENWKEQRGKMLIEFSKAPEVVAKAERAIAALENINTSGFDAAIKQVTDFTGTTSADVGVFNSSVSDFILESLGQLGANPTEGEREFLVAASASLKTSKDVNRALLNRVKNTYQDIIERGKWLVNNPDATRDEYVNWMLSPQEENEMVFDAAGNRIR